MPQAICTFSNVLVQAYELRDAGAVLHSHSLNAVMATLIDEDAKEFNVTHLEMIKVLCLCLLPGRQLVCIYACQCPRARGLKEFPGEMQGILTHFGKAQTIISWRRCRGLLGMATMATALCPSLRTQQGNVN